VLLNNNFLGNVRQWQHLFFNSIYSATPMVNPDFKTIAEAYGIKAEDVAHRDNLADAVCRMREHNGAYLLNVNIDETYMVFPMTPGGHGVDDSLYRKPSQPASSDLYGFKQKMSQYRESDSECLFNSRCS